MNFNWKKILAVIGFCAVTLGLAYLIYFLFFRPEPSITPETPTGEAPGGELPTAGTGVKKPTEITPSPETILPVSGPILRPPSPLPPQVSEVAQGGSTWTATLTQKPVKDFILSADGQNLQYYDKSDGKFYRITTDGKATLLSDKAFKDVDKVGWAPDTNKAILEFPDGSNIVFDFTTQKQVTLPKHWEKFDFSPDSTQISGISMGVSPDNRWLFTANADGSNAQTIEPVGNNADKVKVSWSPNNQIIATSRTGEAQGFDRQMVLMVGKHGENFKGLMVEGWGFDYKWSPTGKNILYNVYNSASDYKPLMWISGAQGDDIGEGRRSLGINTWAEKCDFSDEATLYCAVPESLDRGAGMAPSLSNYTPDIFYKIDLKTGLRSVIATPYPNKTAASVSVSPDGEYLFFTDRASGQLNRLRLR
jgi:WD40 repeat protein